MRKTLIATTAILGITFSQSVKAVTYTHNLIYTPQDQGTLTGRVTFEAGDPNASQDQGSAAGAVDLDTSLITDVQFTYTLSGTEYKLTYSDITHFAIEHKGTTDYSDATDDALLNDLDRLQFFSTGGAFELGRNNAGFTQNADVSGSADDFILTGTTYHSPAPLPILGILPVFSALKKLKSRYKLKFG